MYSRYSTRPTAVVRSSSTSATLHSISTTRRGSTAAPTPVRGWSATASDRRRRRPCSPSTAPSTRCRYRPIPRGSSTTGRRINSYQTVSSVSPATSTRRTIPSGSGRWRVRTDHCPLTATASATACVAYVMTRKYASDRSLIEVVRCHYSSTVS